MSNKRTVTTAEAEKVMQQIGNITTAEYMAGVLADVEADYNSYSTGEESRVEEVLRKYRTVYLLGAFKALELVSTEGDNLQQAITTKQAAELLAGADKLIELLMGPLQPVSE